MKNEFTWCKRDGRGAPWKLIDPTNNAISQPLWLVFLMMLEETSNYQVGIIT